MRRSHRRIDPQVLAGIGFKLYSELSRKVVGQTAAIRSVVNGYQKRLSGMSPAGQPVANYLFLGPTGSGKTWLVESTAEIITGVPNSALIIDCGEYQHEADISKLIGAPPSYVGHKETEPLLCQKNLDAHLSKRCQMSFVLFDEIEKASEKLWNLLLGILDKARMRTGNNQMVNFEKCMIFMTSNLGATEMEKFLAPPMGLAPGPSEAEISQRLGQVGTAAARKRFTREFFNRLDHVVTFNPLNANDLNSVLDLELGRIQETIFEQMADQSYIFAVSSPARQRLIAEGTDSRFGARHLRRAISRLLVDPLANLVGAGEIKAGSLMLMDWTDGAFHFYEEFRKLTPRQMEVAYSVIYEKGKAVPSARDLRIKAEETAA